MIPVAPFFTLSVMGHWLNHAVGKVVSRWLRIWQEYLESNPKNRQAELLLWMVTSVFHPQKGGEKTPKPQRLRCWNFVWDKFWNFSLLNKSKCFIYFWINTEVHWWAVVELHLLTAGFGSLWPRTGRLAECPQRRMPALQTRPEPAEAPADQPQDFGDRNPSLLGCLVYSPYC